MNTQFKSTQILNGKRINIVKNKAGNRFAVINERQMIPLCIVELSAGKDAWMRGIEFKCACCGIKHKAAEMENEHCESCVMEAYAENEELDS